MDVLNLEDIIEKQALLLGLFVKIVPLVSEENISGYIYMSIETNWQGIQDIFFFLLNILF